MKNKIIFLVCAVFLTVACEKEQHTGKESRVSVTVYDENGKVMPGIPVKMYEIKRTSAFPARMWANDSSRYITAISIFSCASSKMSFTSFIFLLFEVAFSLKLCKYNCFTTDYTDLHRLFYPIICVNLNPYHEFLY